MKEVPGTMQRCQAGSKNHGLTTTASGIGIARPFSHIPAPLHVPKISPSRIVPEIGVPEKFPCVDEPKISVYEVYQKFTDGQYGIYVNGQKYPVFVLFPSVR